MLGRLDYIFIYFSNLGSVFLIFLVRMSGVKLSRDVVLGCIQVHRLPCYCVILSTTRMRMIYNSILECLCKEMDALMYNIFLIHSQTEINYIVLWNTVLSGYAKFGPISKCYIVLHRFSYMVIS